MLRPDNLPPILRLEPFAVAEALELGVSAGDLRSRALQRPFDGARSMDLDLSDDYEVARAYGPRLRETDVFSHSTAARLWNLPLPAYLASDLHVSATNPGRAPEAQGVIGHKLVLAAGDIRLVNGMPVTSPSLTWATMAGLIRPEDLIALGDAVITPPFRSFVGLARINDLRYEVHRRRGSRGQRSREAAIEQIRCGPLSRPESLVRIVCLQAGIPAPELNMGPAGEMPDLRWLQYRVCLEYLGDGHRSVAQFRFDVGRNERFLDDDWLVMKVTADDLFDRPEQLVTRLASRLSSRGWVGTVEVRKIVRFRR